LLLFNSKMLDEKLSVESLRRKVNRLLGEFKVGKPMSKENLIEFREMYSSFIEISKRRDDEIKRLRKINLMDDLTDAHNKGYLISNLENYTKQGYPFSLIYMDINHLKKVNDNYVHMIGEQMTKTLASTAILFLREGTDIISRLYGDEFAILLPGRTMKQAFDEVADPLRKKYEEITESYLPLLIKYLKKDKNPIKKVTISQGITSFPNPSENSGLVVNDADRTMYLAKEIYHQNFRKYEENYKKLLHQKKNPREIESMLKFPHGEIAFFNPKL